MKLSSKNLEPFWHGLFWVLLFGLTLGLSRTILPARLAFIIGISRLGILMLVVYGHAFLLAPFVFPPKKKIIVYLVGTVSLCALSIFLLDIVFQMGHEARRLAFERGQIKFPFPNLPRGGPPRYFPHIFLTILSILISAAYVLAKTVVQKERQKEVLRVEKSEYELNFLRSQINPHFLFNALNNLHAIFMIYPEKGEKYLLKLSEMLRYVLEECKQPRVSLKKEMQYLHNYIFFQQAKEHESKKINFQVEGRGINEVSIEPMLLIVLLENAFQHSYSPDDHEQFICIKVEVNEDVFRFQVRNNIPLQQAHAPQETLVHHGIGLQNVKRRLELNYPQSHTLNHGPKGNEYIAEITINRSFL
ncbi:MAG: histidine kinase [Bacteroidota bacterium]